MLSRPKNRPGLHKDNEKAKCLGRANVTTFPFLIRSDLSGKHRLGTSLMISTLYILRENQCTYLDYYNPAKYVKRIITFLGQDCFIKNGLFGPQSCWCIDFNKIDMQRSVQKLRRDHQVDLTLGKIGGRARFSGTVDSSRSSQDGNTSSPVASGIEKKPSAPPLLVDIFGTRSINFVFDVGAGKGEWMRQVYMQWWMSKTAKLVGFELPQPIRYKEYNMPGFWWTFKQLNENYERINTT